MKRISILLTIAIYALVLPVKTLAQEKKSTTGNVKNIVEVNEDTEKTTVKFPGGNIEVNNYSDTITKITLGHRRFEVIENYNHTRIRMVRVPREKFKGHFAGVDLGFNGFMASGFTTSKRR